MDFTRILGGLYQGSALSEDMKPETLRKQGFDVLVLCAEELQFLDEDFQGIRVIRAPNDDSGPPPTPFQEIMAKMAADLVARDLKAGKKVLVTCAAGRNRSGLVSALALVNMGKKPDAVISLIRRKREDALTNEHFVRLIKGEKLPALETAAAGMVG